jgi:hypothetical protein
MGKNKAMLFKWLWRISSENSARWKEFILKSISLLLKMDYQYLTSLYQEFEKE